MQLAPDGAAHRVGVELPDGTVIAGRVDRGPRPWFWGSPWFRARLSIALSHGGELSLYDRARTD